jgi:hypothetical protein
MYATLTIIYNFQLYKVVYDCIIYILYCILAYIEHNGDVLLENYKEILRAAALVDKYKRTE